MGRWFANFARQNKWNTTIMDINIIKAKRVAKELGAEVAKTSAEAVAEAYMVIVAVPIAKTPEVVTTVAGHMRKGALLMDIASAKSEVVDAMCGLDVDLELVSIHPLFGPGASSVKDKNFVAIPVKRGKRYAEFKHRLKKLGARVIEMRAKEHDHLMAVMQCLTHFVLLSYLSALESMGDLKHAMKLRIPTFAGLFDRAKAILAGNPDLFGEIQVSNKYAQIARSAMIEACRSLDKAFATHDVKAAQRIFEKMSPLIGKAHVQAAYKRLYDEFEQRIK